MKTNIKYRKVPTLAYGGSTFYDEKPVRTIQEQQANYRNDLEKEQNNKAGTEAVIDTGLGVASAVSPYGALAAGIYAAGKGIDSAVSNKDEYGVASGSGGSSNTRAAVGSLANPVGVYQESFNQAGQGKWGDALLGALVPVAGAYNNNVKKSKLRDEELQRQAELEQRYKNAAELSNYPVFGNMDVSYYSKGGLLPHYVVGGELDPVGMGAVEVDANRAGKDTVTLTDGNKPVAKVDDGEIIFKNMVFSNRVPFANGKTFADQAKGLVAINDEDGLHKLFEKQEALGYSSNGNHHLFGGKTKYYDPETTSFVTERDERQARKRLDAKAVPEYELGYDDNGNLVSNNPNPTNQPVGFNNPSSVNNKGIYGDTADNVAAALPYLNMAANLATVTNRPKITPARPHVAPNLNTNFDVNSQLADIDRNAIASNTDIDYNTSNSGAARNAKLAVAADALNRKGKIYSTKAQVENELKNAKAISDANVANFNIDQLSNYDALRTQAQAEKQNDVTKALAFGTQTALSQNQETNRNQLDQQRMLVNSYVNSTGNTAAMRNSLSDPSFRAALDNHADRDVFKERIAIDQAGVDEWNRLYPNEPIELNWKRR